MATKNISDIQVLQAFVDFRAAEGMDRPMKRGQIFGMSPPAAETKWPYDLLMERTGEPFKVCYRAMERAEGRGLLDCGVSLRTGWLTDKGKALLAQAIEAASAVETTEIGSTEGESAVAESDAPLTSPKDIPDRQEG